jgi:Arc/MetJ family transcription regulator
MSEIRTVQPTMITIDEELIRRVIVALDLGLEHTRTTLAEYDDEHGRDSMRHRQWCETLEDHVRQIQASRNEFRAVMGWLI